MEEYFIISEAEIEKLLQEAKSEALEVVKAELTSAIAEMVRKKVERKVGIYPLHPERLIAQKQQSSGVKQQLSISSEDGFTIVNQVEEAPSVAENVLPFEEEIVPSAIKDVLLPQKTESIKMEETLEEIERIKSRIACNEELLQQAKTQTQTPIPGSLRNSDSLRKSADVSPVDGDGLYVYCVTNELEGNISDLFSSLKRNCDENLEAINGAGIDGQNPVFSLINQGLSAIVSHVPLSEFNEAEITQKAASGDLSWFEEKSRHHELVIRSVMEKNTVIPMKFCTIYTSEGNVLQFLEEHKNELRKHLDYFAGKSEWGVKMYCNVDRLAEEKSKQQSNEEIKPKSPGAAYFAKRKQDISMETELRQLMYDTSQGIYDRLAKFAVASQRNELPDSKATGKEEPMILNAAYLVKQSELASFNHELAKIQEEQNPFGYELAVSGPWPPYNFVKSLAANGQNSKKRERW